MEAVSGLKELPRYYAERLARGTSEAIRKDGYDISMSSE
jgi:hypothetical protein